MKVNIMNYKERGNLTSSFTSIDILVELSSIANDITNFVALNINIINFCKDIRRICEKCQTIF